MCTSHHVPVDDKNAEHNSECLSENPTPKEPRHNRTIRLGRTSLILHVPGAILAHSKHHAYIGNDGAVRLREDGVEVQLGDLRVVNQHL